MQEYTPSFPPVPIQHSRCVMAVSVAKAVMQLFKEPADKALIGQLQKIRRWLDDCEKQIRERPLSRGAQRDIDRKLSHLDAAFNVKDLDDEALFQRVCTLVWTADTFILDVRCTCPEFRTARCWRYLWQTWAPWQRHCLKFAPVRMSRAVPCMRGRHERIVPCCRLARLQRQPPGAGLQRIRRPDL